MAYVVRITARAERDLASLYEEIHATDSGASRKWYRGLKKAILSLSLKPNRCPVTRENKKLRHLLYGRKPHVYRVIYLVNAPRNLVEIVHIRYAARRGFRPKDLAS